VLDLGCSSGLLSARVRHLGHEITAVDVLEVPGVRDRVDRFIQADLDRGLPPEVAEHGAYDVVLAADILEHLREPEQMLAQLRDLLVPRGLLIASVPNFGHWYARGRAALGLFDYDQRGVLDRGHVRFFTRRGIRRRLERAGFSIIRQEATGLPLEVLLSGGGVVRRVLRALDRLAVVAWPTLFGYQFVFQCETTQLPSIVESPSRD
jgi:predicted TPR repeat methyltransferase